MADTNKGRTYDQERAANRTQDRETDPQALAAQDLAARDQSTIFGALGPNWERWTEHVKAHVTLPDADGDGEAEPATPTVPLLVYGDGPNDYIATTIDAGQVMVQDGNDPTGKAWKFPEASFRRFVAHLSGQKVEGDDDPDDLGDNPIEAAIKQQKRTNASVQADREATERVRRTGETETRK